MISLPTVGNDTTEPDVAALPLTPRNPLPYTRQFAAIRSFHTGTEVLRDAGGRWPFGGGPRSCTGDHFARLEAVLTLATLIRRFEIESLGDDFPLTAHFTIVADGAIPARVRARPARKDARS